MQLWLGHHRNNHPGCFLFFSYPKAYNTSTTKYHKHHNLYFVGGNTVVILKVTQGGGSWWRCVSNVLLSACAFVWHHVEIWHQEPVSHPHFELFIPCHDPCCQLYAFRLKLLVEDTFNDLCNESHKKNKFGPSTSLMQPKSKKWPYTPAGQDSFATTPYDMP